MHSVSSIPASPCSCSCSGSMHLASRSPGHVLGASLGATAEQPSPQQGSPSGGGLAPWLAGAVGAGLDTPLSAPSEIKLSVTAAVADCIVDAVLGDLTIAQCKLVSAGGCQHLRGGNAGLGCGMGVWVP